MRKVFFTLIGLLSLHLNAQTFEAVEGKDVEYYPSANGFMDCAIHFKNLTQSPVVLQYKKVSVDFPSTWDVSFCDNRNCFGGFVDEDTMSAIVPEDEKNSLKITVYPNGKADTAVVVYEVWNKYLPSEKITLTYTIMVRWGASTPTYSVSSSVYPNPANNFVFVPSVNSEIIDLQGKIMKKCEGNLIHLNEVPNGIYFIRYKQNGVVLNQKLVVSH
jgi:hypothetical protein